MQLFPKIFFDVSCNTSINLKNNTFSFLGTFDDEHSASERRTRYSLALRQRLSLVCMSKDSAGLPEIAGINVLCKVSKDDPVWQVCNLYNADTLA